MYALGVDLGTTFTAASVWRDGRAEIASLGSRTAAVPSVVLLREDETFLTGEPANRRGLSEPHRVAREFKRRLGDTTPILLGGVPYSAEALMAKLLRWVVEEVMGREGSAPSSVCVSHPANWGPYKTDLLRQAVRIAGLELPVSFTTEPEAAAVFYAQQQRIEPGATVAVYDLGGGTFDAAVLRKTATGFEILGQPEGIERLGGIDFDAAVFSHVVHTLGGKFEELDEDDPTAIAAVSRLREECVVAKEALSADTDATIPVLLPNVSTEVRLTRGELEAMVRPALYGSIEALKRAVRSAGVAPEDLHSVLLVGGSSRMPIVSQLVGAELARPVAVDAHPKHAIALGAAYLAAAPLGAAIGGPAPGAASRGVASVTIHQPPEGSAPTSPAPAGAAPTSGPPARARQGSVYGASAAAAAAAAGSVAPVSGAGAAPVSGPGVYGSRSPGSTARPTSGAGNVYGAGANAPVSGAGRHGGGAPPAPPAPPTRPSRPPARSAQPAEPPRFARGQAGQGRQGGYRQPSAALTGGTYGGGAPVYPPAMPPGPPEPLSRGSGGGGRRVALVVGLVVVLLAAAAGVAIATDMFGTGFGQGGNDPTTAPTGTGQTANGQGIVDDESKPADERCTREIRANPRWVCLVSAKVENGQFVLEYVAEWNGSRPANDGGFHLHIYGGNGADPPDSVMGAQAGDQAGTWYNEDREPSTRDVDQDNFSKAIGDAEKVCARMARAGHRLVEDRGGGFKTGNCVPIDRRD